MVVASRSRRHGVTLVEVTIAMAVLVVAIMGMVAMSLKVQSFNEDQSDKRDALMACQEVMEMIVNVDVGVDPKNPAITLANITKWQDDWSRRFYVSPMVDTETNGARTPQHLLLESTIEDISTDVKVVTGPAVPPDPPPTKDAPPQHVYRVTVRIQRAGSTPGNPQYTNNAMDISLVSHRSFTQALTVTP